MSAVSVRQLAGVSRGPMAALPANPREPGDPVDLVVHQVPQPGQDPTGCNDGQIRVIRQGPFCPRESRRMLVGTVDRVVDACRPVQVTRRVYFSDQPSM